MADNQRVYTGGCLCGALRYEARREPRYMGYCYCADCRKASGSAFVPFIGFSSAAITFTGQPRTFTSRSARGGNADRNFCATCGGLVFGGLVGISDEFTIYAGSLDDPSAFRPTIAIFARDRPTWVAIPAGLTVFDTMPS